MKRRSFNIDGAILTWTGKKDPTTEEIQAFRKIISDVRNKSNDTPCKK